MLAIPAIVALCRILKMGLTCIAGTYDPDKSIFVSIQDEFLTSGAEHGPSKSKRALLMYSSASNVLNHPIDRDIDGSALAALESGEDV